MDISFLIDTNIAIQLEEVDETGRIRTPYGDFHSLLIEYRIPFFSHPLSRSDLANDTNERRREEMLSRLGKYPVLGTPPTASDEELTKLFGGITKSNDRIDCQLLYSLRRNCVGYLVTEDEGIHKRARSAGLDERVLRTNEAVDLVVRLFRPSSVRLPEVDEEFTYNVDIADPFFDSLKQDYGFENWFREKCCKKRRKCWTIRVAGQLAGICIYKHDESEEFDGVGFPSVKLCTFKVADEFRGRKYGELLLKEAFIYARKNRINSLWVTVKPKQIDLISLLEQFGFRSHAKMHGDDLVFYKHMRPPRGLPPMSPLDFHVLYSPYYYGGEEIQKYVVPIRPQYHDVLFPEFAPQPTLGGLGNVVPGNTIRKVYLCRSNTKELPPGSLIYFYRSAPQQYVCTLGVVERTNRLDDLESLADAMGKRSVYSIQQVKTMLEQGEVLVIHFRFVEHSEPPVPLSELLRAKVFTGRPSQSIKKLDHQTYVRLKSLWISPS